MSKMLSNIGNQLAYEYDNATNIIAGTQLMNVNLQYTATLLQTSQ